MLQTVKGIYKNGKIELAEIPNNILESQVLITFIETIKPENIAVKSSTTELFSPLRGKVKYFEYITTPTTEEWSEI
ncbi:hypothetical protein [Dolichospermum circinale]|uniref:hypothetical protein n=1 Tax=Dolichospermum circinale TaxID=109265 RepID=UPI0003F59509|nr:hypothetical protein [Dolichospermum circinale]MDB9481225.1 hypothetical protein [Dolichospermum circinale CS-537/05]MDB9468481.1 hypothetical protein [Dolichospermum circinale CS-539/09]MDB9470832.1 hypothetical protein [Dolichospermum circinale CS-539]MDB9475938.1 hypothetical protein [Dolichospermum circinale CS-537/11]MDB9478938.1 hypothetical protein [Dolichospermum circinale CS-537/03]